MKSARVVALAGALAASSSLGCGGAPPPRPAANAHTEAHWQDVFDTMPELFVVIRAKAAREDRVYGPLVRRAVDLARQQSGGATGTRTLDVMSEAEELVMGLRPDTADGPGEMVLVARGVRADVDPAKLVETDGAGSWAPGPPGPVPELVRERDEHGHPVSASLFELPGRTWVIAQGDARTRAREAFAHPFNRPAIDLDPQALAVVRIDGPSLVAHLRWLQDLGNLAAIGRHLRAVTFVLPPGAERSVRATFSYVGEDDAALAEVTSREAIGAVSRAEKKPGFLALVAGARVERGPKSVVLVAPLPPQLVGGLLEAGSAPLDKPL